MTGSAAEFEAVTASALEGFDQWSPERQDSMRRTFIFAFIAGMLCEIRPDEQGVIVDPERAALRTRVRESALDYGRAHPGITALELLRKAHEISVEEHASVAARDKRFGPEAEIAHNAHAWAVTRPEVDEAFAQEALAYAQLPLHAQ